MAAFQRRCRVEREVGAFLAEYAADLVQRGARGRELLAEREAVLERVVPGLAPLHGGEHSAPGGDVLRVRAGGWRGEYHRPVHRA